LNHTLRKARIGDYPRKPNHFASGARRVVALQRSKCAAPCKLTVLCNRAAGGSV